MTHTITRLVAVLAALLALAAPAAASTTVPGHEGRDGTVTGRYVTDVGDCEVTVIYRGDFGGDPYLDDGWIQNVGRCADGERYHYLIVHESDPRYDGDPARAIWGTWEIHVLTSGGPIDGPHGNLLRPALAE